MLISSCFVENSVSISFGNGVKFEFGGGTSFFGSVRILEQRGGHWSGSMVFLCCDAKSHFKPFEL